MLLDSRYREHESMTGENFYSFIARVIVGKPQLNASDLTTKVRTTILSFRRADIRDLPGCPDRNT